MQKPPAGRLAGLLGSDKPVITVLVLVTVLVAVLAGALVTIIKPASLPFHQYVQDIAFMAGALGLGAGIGRGIDAKRPPTNPVNVFTTGAPMPEDEVTPVAPTPGTTPDPVPEPDVTPVAPTPGTVPSDLPYKPNEPVPVEAPEEPDRPFEQAPPYE